MCPCRVQSLRHAVRRDSVLWGKHSHVSQAKCQKPDVVKNVVLLKKELVVYSQVGVQGVLVLLSSAGVPVVLTVCASEPAAADGTETALL